MCAIWRSISPAITYAYSMIERSELTRRFVEAGIPRKGKEIIVALHLAEVVCGSECLLDLPCL